jgi:hypothetical protein
MDLFLIAKSGRFKALGFIPFMKEGKRPTAGVTGGWGEDRLGNGKPLKFKKQLKKRAESQPSGWLRPGVRCRGARFGRCGHDSSRH